MPGPKPAVAPALDDFQNAVSAFAGAVFKIQSADVDSAAGVVAAAAAAAERLGSAWAALWDGFRGSKIQLSDLDRLALNKWIADGWAFLPAALVSVQLPPVEGEPAWEIRQLGGRRELLDVATVLADDAAERLSHDAAAALAYVAEIESWAVRGDARPRLLEEPRPVSRLDLAAWAARSPMAVAASLVHLHDVSAYSDLGDEPVITASDLRKIILKKEIDGTTSHVVRALRTAGIRTEKPKGRVLIRIRDALTFCRIKGYSSAVATLQRQYPEFADADGPRTDPN